MRTFADWLVAPNRSRAMGVIQKWVERWVCRPVRTQNVVGHRLDGGGQIVTQQAFDNAEKSAHVCPFVAESIKRGTLWLIESDKTSISGIEQVVTQARDDFINAAPRFDPRQSGPAGDPEIFKTVIIVFPFCKHVSSYDVLFDTVHKNLKIRFVKCGLMLGQFYMGCPEEGIYSSAFRPLRSPYPLFVIRYMVKPDHLFNEPGTPYYIAYRKFFPA